MKDGYAIEVYRTPLGEMGDRWDRILEGFQSLDELKEDWEYTKKNSKHPSRVVLIMTTQVDVEYHNA